MSADDRRQIAEFVRCEGTLGSKPWWMSWGQYDPCRCDLPMGHEPSADDPSGHSCKHVRPTPIGSSEGGE